jgi:microcystin-dependent protein
MAVLSTVANVAVPPIPVGVIQAYAGVNAPYGWLLCDGSAISRTTYPDLYSALGTAYGAGNGSTTFNIPDMRGRVPMGAGAGAGQGASGTGVPSGTSLTTRTRGAFGGDERMQTHTHIQNAHDHSLGGGQPFGMDFGGNPGGGVTFAVAVASINGPSYQGPYSAVSNTATNQNAGSGSSENMPPFVVCNYIIKAVADISRGGFYNSSSPDVVTQLPINPYYGQTVLLVSGSALVYYRHNGTSWQQVAGTGGSNQIINAYSVNTGATRQDITSSTWAAITGLSVTLTPVSASSRFILLSSIQNSGTYVNSFTFFKNSSSLLSHANTSETGAIRTTFTGQNDSDNYQWETSLSYVDAPATTSSITYDVRATSSWNGASGTIRINDRLSNDMRGVSSFTVLEMFS